MATFRRQHRQQRWPVREFDRRSLRQHQRLPDPEPLAFQRPADGSWGNTTRDEFHLPFIWNVDSAIMKTFFITETNQGDLAMRGLQPVQPSAGLRANTGSPQTTPSAEVSTSDTNFGQANSYRDARVLQVGRRFTF